MYRVSKQVLGKNLAKKSKKESHKTFDNFFDEIFVNSIWRIFLTKYSDINLTILFTKYWIWFDEFFDKILKILVSQIVFEIFIIEKLSNFLNWKREQRLKCLKIYEFWKGKEGTNRVKLRNAYNYEHQMTKTRKIMQIWDEF